jgi:hypothetical protein
MDRNTFIEEHCISCPYCKTLLYGRGTNRIANEMERLITYWGSDEEGDQTMECPECEWEFKVEEHVDRTYTVTPKEEIVFKKGDAVKYLPVIDQGRSYYGFCEEDQRLLGKRWVVNLINMDSGYQSEHGRARVVAAWTKFLEHVKSAEEKTKNVW